MGKNDIVSREAVMQALIDEYNKRFQEQGLKLAWIEKAVNSVKSAVPDRPEGYWKHTDITGEAIADRWECSECGWEYYSKNALTNYCPSCGAKMKESEA